MINSLRSKTVYEQKEIIQRKKKFAVEHSYVLGATIRL